MDIDVRVSRVSKLNVKVYQSALFKQSISAFFERRSLTQSRWLLATASCKARFKSLFRCSMSTPRRIKNFIKSRWPWRAATIIGVSPDFKWTQFNMPSWSALESTILMNSSRLLAWTKRKGRGYSKESCLPTQVSFITSAILVGTKLTNRGRGSKKCLL